LDLPAGEFATEITLPENSRGPCHLRLVVANQNSQALGSANVFVRPRMDELSRVSARAR
jgi:hypothetical protein